MARLTENIEVSIGEDGLIVLREPTTKELNGFNARAYPISRKGRMGQKATEHRVEFFDLLFLRLQNIEDPGGNPIPPDGKEMIPVRYKDRIILERVEQVEEINEKN